MIKKYGLTWLNNLPSLDLTTTAGSMVAPLVTPEFLPRPYRMTLVVTRQCNSRCQMCNIWQQKDLKQLSIEQLETIFSSNDFSFLRSITLTGGEPTMRADLPDVFEVVARNCANLEGVYLATSALNTARTLRFVEQMLQAAHKYLPNISTFEVQISVDGIGDLHDEVRGIPGFFDRVCHTMDGLNALKTKFPILAIRLSSVVLPHNIQGINDIRIFAQEHNLPIHFSPVVISGSYYENQGTSNNSQPSENKTIIELFDNLAVTESSALRFHYQDIVGMLHGDKRQRQCMMGYYDCVLEYNGDLYSCVNCESYSFGNLLTNSFDEVWFGDQALQARRKVRENCCPTCPSPCHYPPVSPKEIFELKWWPLQRRITQFKHKLQRSAQA